MTDYRRSLIPFAFFLLAIATLVPVSPALNSVPDRDSGVFLYIGERILDGDLPYRDVWDHKPPAIHYLNALGLFVGQGSWWGLWLLECIAIGLTLAGGYCLLQRVFGCVPATVSMSCVAAALLILNDGNMVEEFALPFHFGALWVFVSSRERRTYWWRGILLGVLMGGAFLLRQNLIGVWGAIGLYEVALGLQTRRLRYAILRSSIIGIGFACVVIGIAGYFAARGGLDELWDAAFRYNLIYSAEFSAIGVFANFFYGFFLILASGMPLVAIAAWGVIANDLRLRRTLLPQEQALVTVAFLGLPLEFGLTSVSQMLYGHYFVAWLPLMAVLTGFAVKRLLDLVGNDSDFISQRRLYSLLLLGGGLLLITAAWMPAWKRADTTENTIVVFIRTATEKEDTVLMWGADAAVNFAARRKSPSRFVYQYPLYTPGYQTPSMVAEFLADLESSRPVIVVDDRSDLNNIPPLDENLRRRWSPPEFYVPLPEMEAVYAYIASHYQFVDNVGEENQYVYVLRESP